MLFDYNGLKINYEIFGEGTPLLVLHGWMACIEAMSPIYNYFKNTHKVYVLDFPGQGGKSDELPDVWGVAEYASLVKSFINSMNIQKTDVIGHSFGGRVIIELASENENIFNKIILTDAAGVKPKSSIKKKIKILSYKFSKMLLKFTTPKELYEEKLNEMRKKYGSSDYGTLKNDIMRESFKRIINYNQTNKLRNIKNPTLLMWGELDMDTPLYMARVMESKIKDSGLVILKGAGHFSYIDQSAQYLKVVDNFLGGK